uniref:HIRA interacting protein 3 n=1 Tax=Pipistrellus kuhlii TaxID=59472 RepID=A0A7J7S5R7_PIPKU|nr:HIRA interacting protein 3 [Pipistrellus kuhlii]
MARENEMREFTRSFFRGRPDLSTLTHSIVRRKFLAHTGSDHLSPKEKQALKRLVEEELLKMQVDEAGARGGLNLAKKTKKPPTSSSDPERKRFRLNSDSEPSAAASSPDCFSHPAKNGMGAAVSPAEESPNRASKRAIESSDEEEQQRDLTAYKTGLEEEEAVKESSEEESSDRTSKVWKEESSEEGNKEKDSKGRTRKKRVTKDRTQWAGGRRQSGSSEEDGEDSCRKLKPATKGRGKSAKAERRKTTNGEASDSEREASDSEAGGSPQGERKGRSYRKSAKQSRSRSSSSSSANGSPEPKGRKAGHRDEDHPAVMRLKRYIRACGAHRNYKKLLGSCRSRKERLSVLRAELEALGMKGNPSLEKCRALKEQREEAAEVASLDITNIISCSGRPRRRTAWNPSEPAAPGELYRRTLDSEEEQHCPPRPDWSHMRGIISSDGESN